MVNHPQPGRSADSLTVRENTEAGRFELHDPSGAPASLRSFAEYRCFENTLVVPHVETLVHHRGNGYAEELLARIAEIVRADGRTLRPTCPFAAAYFRTRPDLADVVR